MTERTEWPTPEKLARLREEGIVHYSRLATACFLLAAVAGVGRILAPDVSALVARYRSGVGEVGGAHGWATLAEELGWFVGLSGVVGGLTVLVSILFQTKVLLKPERLAPSLERLNPFAKMSVRAPFRRLWQGVFGLGGGIFVAAVLVATLFRDMAGLLNHEIDYLGAYARPALERVLGAVALCAGSAGVVVWWSGWFVFRFRQRMTRAEVLADRSER